jgi:hypothetical protein
MTRFRLYGVTSRRRLVPRRAWSGDCVLWNLP